MPPRLTGVLYAFSTHILYVGPLIATARHSHHAGQVMWAPGGVVVEVEGAAPRRAVTHVVPPNRFHQHGAASLAAVLWVDRDDIPWDQVPQSASRERGLAAGVRLDESPGPDAARELARELLDVVAPARSSQAPAARHPAVKRMCALLDAKMAAVPVDPLRVTQLARESRLSLRQLRHHFTEQLGINPRGYLRWRRLRQAVASIERGATLTQAAIEGGFADAAHFSRVFRAQFGMTPTQALSSVRFVRKLV